MLLHPLLLMLLRSPEVSLLVVKDRTRLRVHRDPGLNHLPRLSSVRITASHVPWNEVTKDSTAHRLMVAITHRLDHFSHLVLANSPLDHVSSSRASVFSRMNDLLTSHRDNDFSHLAGPTFSLQEE